MLVYSLANAILLLLNLEIVLILRVLRYKNYHKIIFSITFEVISWKSFTYKSKLLSTLYMNKTI